MTKQASNVYNSVMQDKLSISIYSKYKPIGSAGTVAVAGPIKKGGSWDIKSFVLGFICVFAGIGFWFFFRDAILFGDLKTFPVWLALVFFTVFMISFSLLLLLAERLVLVVLPFLLGISPILYFFGHTTPVLVCFVIAALGVGRVYLRVRREARSRINFRVPALLREGLPTILTVLSLLFAIAYYVETKQAPERITLKDLMPRALFERVLEYTPAVSENLFPEKDILYDIITQRSEEFIAPYERFLPVGFAIAFFLFLRSVAFPFSWIILWICVGIVKILVAKGLVVRTEELTTKERYMWA